MNKSQAIDFYEEVKDIAEEHILTPTVTKLIYEENGWVYSFFVYKGELKRVEGWNHREHYEINL